jgi:tight adherence protein B
MLHVASALAALAVLLLFIAVWRLAPRRNAVGERLETYTAPADAPATDSAPQRKGGLARWLGRLGGAKRPSRSGQRLATLLAQADVPLAPSEFVMIMLVAGSIGFLVAAWRLGLLAGLGFGIVLAAVPVFWARWKRSRRRRQVGEQLPDVLTLITGALKAGYGLAQAISVVASQGPDPSAKEYERVVRATELGSSLPRALRDMARRIGNDDVDLLVTAIDVQYEVGGSLSTVLENISVTIRERVRILREVRTLTAQQRMSGMVLAALPVAMAAFIWFAQPDFFNPFFEAGWIRFLPFLVVGMVVVAFFLIQRIVDIKV